MNISRCLAATPIGHNR